MGGRTERAPAVLFDIDGTLVDSNYLHVQAWSRAFREAGVPVEAWRVHHAIGMDGGKLLDILSDHADMTAQRRINELHARYYAQSANLLRAFSGTREILRDVAASGLQVILATSAPEDELATLRRLLDCDDLIAAVTSAADVEQAKPDPSIVRVALDKAGVVSIGVLSGGIARPQLEEAGAHAVFSTVADLLEHIDDSPIARLRQIAESR